MNIPIPTTALHLVEYIPSPQDQERYKRKKLKEIQGMEAQLAALERSEAQNSDALQPEERQEQIARLCAEIINERDLVDQMLAHMQSKYPTPQVFILAQPTAMEREQMNSRLVALGLAPVTQEQIRATMVEELFHRDWGKGSDLANEAHAEELANFLDGFWQREDAHNAATERWREQEIERMMDMREGHPPIAQAEQPPKLISVRDQSKMRLLIDDMMATSQKLRNMAAATLDHNRQNAILLARMHIVDVRGIDSDVPLERDPYLRALSEEAVNALREKVDDLSWNDLITHIDQMYHLTGAEVKNSGSLPERQSLPTGSTEPSDSLESSDGSSTTSFSTPAPAAESVMTIAPSSGSTSGFGAGLVSPMPVNDSQTGGA